MKACDVGHVPLLNALDWPLMAVPWPMTGTRETHPSSTTLHTDHIYRFPKLQEMRARSRHRNAVFSSGNFCISRCRSSWLTTPVSTFSRTFKSIHTAVNYIYVHHNCSYRDINAYYLCLRHTSFEHMSQLHQNSRCPLSNFELEV